MSFGMERSGVKNRKSYCHPEQGEGSMRFFAMLRMTEGEGLRMTSSIVTLNKVKGL